MSAISVLLQNPLASCSFVLLIIAIIACWIMPKYYIFAPIFLASYALAFISKIVTFNTLFPLLAIAICIFFLKMEMKRFIHLFASMTLTIIGVLLMSHMIKGFEGIEIYQGLKISDGAPFNMYINFDKAALAVLLLGLYITKLQTKEQWKQIFLITIPCIFVTSSILFFYMKYTATGGLDIKFPSSFFFWTLVNLFFITIPEEAFYRGFLQEEITKNLPNKAAPILSILLVSMLFAGIHLFFIPNLYFIGSVFIASLLYGTIYHFSKSVEASIMTHFFVNVIHFFFFTYPMLAGKI